MKARIRNFHDRSEFTTSIVNSVIPSGIKFQSTLWIVPITWGKVNATAFFLKAIFLKLVKYSVMHIRSLTLRLSSFRLVEKATRRCSEFEILLIFMVVITSCLSL